MKFAEALKVVLLVGTLSFSAAVSQGPDLLDPEMQPKFITEVANALDPSFMFYPDDDGKLDIIVEVGTHYAGIVAEDGSLLPTPIYGYGDGKEVTWPGRTIEAQQGTPVKVRWVNGLRGLPFLLTGKDNSAIGFEDYSGKSVLDSSLHWAYSLPDCTYCDADETFSCDGLDSLEEYGTPLVTHVHGHASKPASDGDPEAFFAGECFELTGPLWKRKRSIYSNAQQAANLFYHDHSLGITRLNIYAGLVGLYFIRDEYDTGKPDNPIGVPAFPYELAFAVQDRMFKSNGELFYPSYPGDPFYKDFIDDQNVTLPEDIFPLGGPTALAEFFGDVMLVNGKIWPFFNVEPRKYRLRLVNGCDSRYLVLQFFEAPAGATTIREAIKQLDFAVIGGDQGLASSTTVLDTLLFEPGSRYDIIVDFVKVTHGNRVIMRNIGPDAPFGSDFDGDDLSMCFDARQTDRIMAFDVVKDFDDSIRDTDLPKLEDFDFGPKVGEPSRVRKLGLFEGTDEFGRLQPLLGTAEPATDYKGDPIYWPSTEPYQRAGLAGKQMQGSIGWHSPTTENPALGATEEWHIFNASGDAHPIHLHLVSFEVIGRQEIIWDSSTNEEDRVLPPPEDGEERDGTYLVEQNVVQHNGELGSGFRLENLTYGPEVGEREGYVENFPKDIVAALPSTVTRIKATFDKPGRYNWHCHILSHEDHEMMRVLFVGADEQKH